MEGKTNPIFLGGGAVLLLGVLAWFFFSGSKEAYVTGKVTLDQQPMGGALVAFIAADEKISPLLAPTNDKGFYKLIGSKGAGVPLGAYKILVSKMALQDGTVPQGRDLEIAREKNLLQNMLPKIYEDPKTTPLNTNIKAGNNTVNLDLKK